MTQHTTPRVRAAADLQERWHVPAAVALILLALGLPWSASTLTYIPAWITPSFCYATVDGLLSCSAGFISPAMSLGAGALTGAGSVARVFLVGALLLILFSRGRSRWLQGAAVSLLAGLLLHGLGVLGGQLATIGAVILLLQAARHPTAQNRPARRR